MVFDADGEWCSDPIEDGIADLRVGHHGSNGRRLAEYIDQLRVDNDRQCRELDDYDAKYGLALRQLRALNEKSELVARRWRDWPQARRDGVRALSSHLHDAIEDLAHEFAPVRDTPHRASETAIGARSGLCASCGGPFRPTHDVESPGPTARHPFTPSGASGAGPR